MAILSGCSCANEGMGVEVPDPGESSPSAVHRQPVVSLCQDPCYSGDELANNGCRKDVSGWLKQDDSLGLSVEPDDPNSLLWSFLAADMSSSSIAVGV